MPSSPLSPSIHTHTSPHLPSLFLIHDRLGLHQTDYPLLSLASCHPRCKTLPIPAATSPDHSLTPLIPFAYHQLACPLLHLPSIRHDALLRIVADAIRPLGYPDASVRPRDCSSSSTSGSRTDLVATSSFQSPPAFSADGTVSVPYLPSYLSHTSTSGSWIHRFRDVAKSAHHEPGSTLRSLTYFSLVWTHLAGFGPDSAIAWLRSVFRRFAALELASGRPAPCDQRLSLLFQSLQASMAKSNQHATHRLTSSQPPPPAPAL